MLKLNPACRSFKFENSLWYLTSLTSLQASKCRSITSINQLVALPKLQQLDLQGSVPEASFQPIRGESSHLKEGIKFLLFILLKLWVDFFHCSSIHISVLSLLLTCMHDALPSLAQVYPRPCSVHFKEREIFSVKIKDPH